MIWTTEVISFWFEKLRPNDWFSSRPELDSEIHRCFGTLRANLKDNPPDPATMSAMGHVAAIIVFDQFSRNMFRGSPEAFATDGIALKFAEDAVDRGLDKSMGPPQRQFLYMPFMHSEDPAVQQRSVKLFRDIGIPDLVKYAEDHKGVIERFGRFPNRNKALDRATTVAEQAYLDSEDLFR